MFSLNLKHFENRFFLEVALLKEAHAIIYTIGTMMKDRCTIIFHKYYNICHFLVGNGLDVYEECNLFQEELYLKKRLFSFVKELTHVGSVTPHNEASKKRLKLFIEIHLLIGVHTKEERNVVFNKF